MSNYISLGESVPLSTPWTVMIEPTNVCNFMCTFCPTGDKSLLKKANRPIGHMSLELFKKIIDDLCQFDSKVKSLRLFKDGESFLNPALMEMVTYAKQKNVSDEVYIISNGSLIDEKLSKEIIESGLDRLRISIEHVNDKKYREITKTYDKYSEIVQNVKYLYEYKVKMKSHLIIDVKIIDSLLNEEEIKKFNSDFEGIADKLTHESLMGWSKSEVKDFTLGTDSSVGINKNVKLRDIKVCPEPFKGLSINFNGSVSVCCVDWSHNTVVGNLNNMSIKDIWNGENLKNFRLLHLNGDRNKIEACADCHYIKGVNELSNLDHIADKLKEDL